ncbi:hypothetical protein [Cellulosimicrobium sp. NPDC057127]|uniref:hypothetical protein n=1 Tax=Cellulosimicrobium sp. NPDC057127 TaxID=3346026 RepID=UPI00362BD89D
MTGQHQDLGAHDAEREDRPTATAGARWFAVGPPSGAVFAPAEDRSPERALRHATGSRSV